MPAELPLPKYHQVYLVLREQLREGRFDGAGLPGELALTREFGVARVTVRKALEHLAGEGLIARRQGRGTTPIKTAAAPRAAPRRAPLSGQLENLVAMGLRTSVKVVSVARIAASAEVAEALRIDPGAPVQKAVRVRRTAEGPLSHITTFVPHELARDIGRRELAAKPILLLLEERGVRVGRAVQTISARLADAETARQLELPVGAALLAVQRLIVDADERPVQWLHGLYRPDRYQYEMTLSRVGGVDARVWVDRELSARFHSPAPCS